MSKQINKNGKIYGVRAPRVIFVFALFMLVFSAAFSCPAQTAATEKMKSVSWEFSDKDLGLDFKDEQFKKGSHTSEIIRQGSDEDKALIKKAEALYVKDLEIKQGYDRNKYHGIFAGNFTPPAEEAPFWSESAFDGVKIAGFISTRAVIYYQALSAAFRSGKSPTSIRMSKTSLGYKAANQHYENYEIGDQKFQDVNVVTLTLSWGQYCGSLCAMGFSRKKVVIFDAKNEPVAMFIDFYGGAWVS